MSNTQITIPKLIGFDCDGTPIYDGDKVQVINEKSRAYKEIGKVYLFDNSSEMSDPRVENMKGYIIGFTVTEGKNKRTSGILTDGEVRVLEEQKQALWGDIYSLTDWYPEVVDIDKE